MDGPSAGPPGATRDLYGFEVKREYVELFRKYAPLWEAEEVERQERWESFLSHDVHTPRSSSSGEGAGPGPAGPCMDKVNQLLDNWTSIDEDSKLQEDQHQLRSLVQAGIPMNLRGKLWTKFLGLKHILVEGEYHRLLKEVEVNEQAGGDDDTRDPYYIIHSNKEEQWVEFVVPEPQSESEANGQADSPTTDNPSGTKPTQQDEEANDARSSPQTEPQAHATPEAKPRMHQVVSQGETRPPGSPLSPDSAMVKDSAYDWNSQIEKDLHRTFPGHPVMDAHGRSALRRILSAYSIRNPCVGYCQGMNFVAGTLLLFMEEEEAFWCLVAVIENLMAGYYSLAMLAPQVDQQVFGQMLSNNFPTLANHMDDLGVDMSCVTSQWFLCLFVNALPLETCLRVWDVLFLERDTTILFKVALALVDIFSRALMATVDSVDALSLLQATAPMSFDGSRLMSTACIGFQDINRGEMISLRKKYWTRIFNNAMSQYKEGSLEYNACKYEQQKFDLVARSMEEPDLGQESLMTTRGLSANSSMRVTKAMKAAEAEAAFAATPARIPPATAPPELRGVYQQPTEARVLEGTRLFDGPQAEDWGEAQGSGQAMPLHRPQQGSPMTLGRDLPLAGSKMSRLQKMSDSPFKLLYILPESATTPAAEHSDPAELTMAAATALQIASTPSPHRDATQRSRVAAMLSPPRNHEVRRFAATTGRKSSHSRSQSVAADFFGQGSFSRQLFQDDQGGSQEPEASMRLPLLRLPSDDDTIAEPDSPASRAVSRVKQLGRTPGNTPKAVAQPITPRDEAESDPGSQQGSDEASHGPGVQQQGGSDPEAQEQENGDGIDKSLAQMIWVVENMEQEVLDARRLRMQSEENVLNLKDHADFLSEELALMTHALTSKTRMCEDLQHRLNIAAFHDQMREEDLGHATEMHAIACQMLSLMDIKTRPKC